MSLTIKNKHNITNTQYSILNFIMLYCIYSNVSHAQDD